MTAIRQSVPSLEDRMALCERPAGAPIMYMDWSKLLFMHWRVRAELLRPLIPSALELDDFNGETWIAVAPFTMTGIRPLILPSVPVLSDSHELNVRTYVHHKGVPGVWFMSLEASNPLAVIFARLGFNLPYYQAEMHMKADGDTVRFTSKRMHPGAKPAEFDAAWLVGEQLPLLEPGSREFFLMERYALYAEAEDGIMRARIHHEPWPMRKAALIHMQSTMLESHGLEAPSGLPLLHAQTGEMHVEVFAPVKV